MERTITATHEAATFVMLITRCFLRAIASGVVFSLFLVLVILLLNSDVNAQTERSEQNLNNEITMRPAEVKRGSLLFRNNSSFVEVPLLHTDVQINVTAMISRTRVRQKFSNTSEDWQEGVYVFPLPEDSAVDHMKLVVGERIIEGEIKEKAEARKIYTESKRSGKKASLIEQERPNIFTTSVANIAPGETIIVEIEYQEILKYDNETFSLRFPLVVAPRYIPGTTPVQGFLGTGWAMNTNQVPDASRITPYVSSPDKPKINPVNISITINPGFELNSIHSPYHEIDIESLSNAVYRVQLRDQDVPADRDFVLSWKPVAGQEPRAAMFKQQHKDNEYALLMVLPPTQDRTVAMDREVIFIIDTSGSMGGVSIRQARQALQYALERLKPGDFFNIIQFNSHTSQLFPYAVPASRQKLRIAKNYVLNLDAGGGTEMAPALHAALMNQTDSERVRQVIFLTDGSVGNENMLFEIIQQQLDQSRLFTIGIGSAPNSHFMARAAEYGRGTHTYIGNIDEVQEQMMHLFSKLERPVLSSIRLTGAEAYSHEMWPQLIPDLYAGEPLIVTIKAQKLMDNITVSGQLANQTWQSDITLSGGQSQDGIHGLWARKKIASLMSQQTRANESGSVRDLIVETALEHHLVSKYTSLVAVDKTPARSQAEKLKSAAMPTNLPAGWQYDKVFGQMPATATPAALHLLLGSLLVMTGWASRFIRLRLLKGKSM